MTDRKTPRTDDASAPRTDDAFGPGIPIDRLYLDPRLPGRVPGISQGHLPPANLGGNGETVSWHPRVRAFRVVSADGKTESWIHESWCPQWVVRR